MTTRNSVVLTACLAILLGTAMLAAPGQDRQGISAQGTERPGQPTKGQVWIENRGRSEAIPVVIQEAVPVVVQNVVTNTMPMPVRLAGNSPGAPPSPVAVRQAIQSWEYRILT